MNNSNEQEICIRCKNHPGYRDWEIVDNTEPLCCDCAWAGREDQKAPPEWYIDD